jgi:prepilin signal peptidase PulO-like enzyme (type II secretory pathway)
MNVFDRARARADQVSPPPPDQPNAAALTAFGFGLLVIGMFIALQWIGMPLWMAWIGAAALYGAIGYFDCLMAWKRHRQEFHDALADAKDGAPGPSLH